MRNALRALCGLGLVGSAACNQVWNAVTTEDCQPGSTNPECASTGWPTTDHGANSDPWLVTHNQVITSMKPNVLVLNFDNSVTSADTMTTAQTLAGALDDGSKYQGYLNAAAPQFLQYNILPIVDLTNYNPNNPTSNPNNPPIPPGWTNPSSSLLPTDSTGQFDAPQLFQPQFADFGISDPTTSQPYTLCQLFEKGKINEVWIQDGETDMMGGPQRRAPLYLERKQTYDTNGAAISGSFEDCIGGGSQVYCLDNIQCGVTVRLLHIDPSTGEGVSCDLEVQGWGIEGMWKVLPPFQADAYAFLNRNFNTRFNLPFNGWSDICDGKGTPCVTYPADPTQFSASSPAGVTPSWNIPSPTFRQGCGSSQFQPNATLRGDFPNTTTNVESRCAHFGLGDGDGGGDAYEIYPAAMVAEQDQTYSGVCGGGWQIYWRQSMPGYQNKAIASDGTPMKNWWPILFY